MFLSRLIPCAFALAISIAPVVLAADQTGWYQVEKVSLEFHELIRVELQGTVVESSDPSVKGISVPFLQSLHYFNSMSRPIQRSFPAMNEVRDWIQNELCRESHDQTLRPLRETGSIGSFPIKSRLKPTSVIAYGTRIGTKGVPVDETVYCKTESR